MERLLICGGLFGQKQGLTSLTQAVKNFNPDAIFFVGGILPQNRGYTPRDTAWGMSQEDAQAVHRFLETLGRQGCFTAVIPGPLDTPLDEFLRMGMHTELEQPTVHIVHATPVVQGDTIIVGLGGQLCDGPSCEPDSISRTMAEYFLRHLPDAKQPRKVLLLSEPLRDCSHCCHSQDLCRELINSVHPTLCAVAGPTETAGAERWGKTLVVNPGSLADGSAILVDWGRPSSEQVNVLDLHKPEVEKAL